MKASYNLSFKQSKLDTTILVPTYNRPSELQRLLFFLKALNNRYPIIILDGGCPKMQELASKFIQNFDEPILHLCFPEDLHLGKRLAISLNEYVDTKYIVCCADDDFIIPNCIQACSEFLDKNDDFSAAMGLARCLAYPKKYPRFGFFAFLNALNHPLILDQPSFISRFLRRLALEEVGVPPLFYAVRRTEQAKTIFNIVPDTFKYTSMELLSNAMTLHFGKAITLPHLLVIRNYSSEPTRDLMREDLEYCISQEDALQIRNIMTEQLRNGPEPISNDVIHYLLDQFISIPVKKVGNRLTAESLKTDLNKYFLRKRNWLFYILNYCCPGFIEKLDSSIQKSVVKALKKSFKSC